MLYYNPKYNLLGVFWTVDGVTPLIKISEDTEFIPFTNDWMMVGSL